MQVALQDPSPQTFNQPYLFSTPHPALRAARHAGAGPFPTSWRKEARPPTCVNPVGQSPGAGEGSPAPGAAFQSNRKCFRTAAMIRFYITTAIPYANGAPHIGHAYERIATDAIQRFMRLDGRDTLFVTGLDEHGLKVQQAAAREGLTP